MGGLLSPTRLASVVLLCLVAISTSAIGRRTENAAPPPVQSGVYVYYDWRNLAPKTYPWIVGGEMSWRWTMIEAREGSPNWSQIDNWLNSAVSVGKSTLIKISPHDRQYDGVPDYVYAAGVPKVWVGSTAYPKWWDPIFISKYAGTIARLGQKYDRDSRVGAVAVSIGEYGEAMPGSGGLDWRVWPQYWTNEGLTSAIWVDYNKQIIDAYVAAFPNKPLFLQEQSFPDGNTPAMWEVTDYAAANGVHMGFNGLRWENDKDTHWYDPFSKYVEPGRLMGRLEQGPPDADQRQVYWSVLNALRNHVRVLSFYDAQSRDRGNKEAFEFANKYAGKTLATTPGVWSALKEVGEYNGHPGNYEFWLYQIDPAGTSLPVYNLGTDKRGMYARRTDQASGKNYLVFDVDDRFMNDGSYEVTVFVTYLDSGNDLFELRFDSVDGAEVSAGQVRKGNSQTWKVVKLKLSDARFGNNLRGGDLLLYGRQDGDDVFHMVEVTKGSR